MKRYIELMHILNDNHFLKINIFYNKDKSIIIFILYIKDKY